jgi:Tol biopolymer transport system component
MAGKIIARIFLVTALLCPGASSAQQAPVTSGPAALDPASFGRLGRTMTQGINNQLIHSRATGTMELVQKYPSGRIRRIAQRTGMLDLLMASGERDGCTATAITDRLILTNAHCVHISGRDRVRQAFFFMAWEDEARRDTRPRYAVKLPPLERDWDRDYALLELAAPIAGLTPLQVTVRDPEPGEPMFMLSLPGGGVMHVARFGCQADVRVPVDGMTVNHHCDTLQGSSGALGFADDGALVTLHHAGGNRLNHGIRMASIVQNSAALRRVFGGVGDAPQVAATPTIVAPPDVFTPDWTLPPKPPRTLSGHTNGVKSAVFSPDGRFIVSASYDETGKIWDAQTGRALRTLSEHGATLSSASFSPDGRFIVSTLAGAVKVWDAQTGQALRRFKRHQGSVRSAALSASFSPDGRFIVSALVGGIAKIWDAQTGRALRTLTGHGGWVLCASFSPDGRFIVSASHDKTLKIWNAQTGRELRTLSGHGGIVNSASFSPDGRLIVSASTDQTVKVWDAQTGRALRTLSGHASNVNSAAFSPDGRFIVSASSDETVKVWDAHTGRALQTLSGYGAPVSSAAFSPDGRFIVSASHDKTLKVWEVPGEMH